MLDKERILKDLLEIRCTPLNFEMSPRLEKSSFRTIDYKVPRMWGKTTTIHWLHNELARRNFSTLMVHKAYNPKIRNLHPARFKGLDMRSVLKSGAILDTDLKEVSELVLTSWHVYDFILFDEVEVYHDLPAYAYFGVRT